MLTKAGIEVCNLCDRDGPLEDWQCRPVHPQGFKLCQRCGHAIERMKVDERQKFIVELFQETDMWFKMSEALQQLTDDVTGLIGQQAERDKQLQEAREAVSAFIKGD